MTTNDSRLEEVITTAARKLAQVDAGAELNSQIVRTAILEYTEQLREENQQLTARVEMMREALEKLRSVSCEHICMHHEVLSTSHHPACYDAKEALSNLPPSTMVPREELLRDILVILAGAGVPTPEEGYIKDGGLSLALSDIKRALHNRVPRADAEALAEAMPFNCEERDKALAQYRAKYPKQ